MTPAMSRAKRRPNDVGGRPAGRVASSSHAPEPWERLLTALVNACGPTDRKLLLVDEFRRVREDLGEAFHTSLGYFELWTQAFIDLLEEKGVLSRAEVNSRAAEIRKRLGAIQ
jgi:hypothetical protein